MAVANTLAYYDVHAIKGFVVQALSGVLWWLHSYWFQLCQQILDLGGKWMAVANNLAYYNVHAIKGFIVHVLAGVLYGLLSIRLQPCQQILDLGVSEWQRQTL
jgi:hypothetical protein